MFKWNKQSHDIILKIQMKTKVVGIGNEQTSSGLEKTDSSFSIKSAIDFT
jgi:hypothetical protein